MGYDFLNQQCRWYCHPLTTVLRLSVTRLGLEPLEWKDPEAFEFPFAIRVYCALTMIGGMALLFLVLYGAARFFVFVGRLGATWE